LSSVIQLLSGVVQGSGIGPLLFLSYRPINELAEILGRAGVNVKLFADDVKLYMQIVSSCDTAKLQYALDSVTEWAKAWQLTVSINKCCLLSTGRMSPAAPVDFYIDGHKMSLVSSCRDLGVLVSQDLKPTAHIKQMVASAHRRASAILHSFFCRQILTRLYVLLMCTFYRYLSIIVGSPQGKQNIECIERVQSVYPG